MIIAVLCIIILQVLLLVYTVQQLWHPFAFPRWRLAWSGMSVMIVLMCWRRLNTLLLILGVSGWWIMMPDLRHLDQVIIPGLVTLCQAFSLWHFQHIFPVKAIHGLATPIHGANIAIDQESRIIAWEGAAFTLFGYTQTEALGQPLYELIMPAWSHALHREQLTAWVADDGGVRSVGRTLYVTAKHKDGREFPVQVFVVPRTEADGNVTFHSIVHRLVRED